jgi:hypothetical protein
MKLRSQKEVVNKSTRPDMLLNKKVVYNLGNSHDATKVLFANVLKLVKIRTSVFTNLKSELNFQRQFGASELVKFLVDHLKLQYTYYQSIEQLIDSLDLAWPDSLVFFKI